jgi:hypothetical protein
MRRVPAAWVWPITTFVVIAASIGVFVVFRVATYASSSDSPGVSAPLAPARHVNTRTWRTIAEDPTGHADERVVLWGRVTQFDPTVDGSTFRANVDAAHHAAENGVVRYPTSVIMHGDPGLLRKLVHGYTFTADATVDAGGAPGTVSDGRGPVPTLTVTRLTITDKTAG